MFVIYCKIENVKLSLPGGWYRFFFFFYANRVISCKVFGANCTVPLEANCFVWQYGNFGSLKHDTTYHECLHGRCLKMNKLDANRLCQSLGNFTVFTFDITKSYLNPKIKQQHNCKKLHLNENIKIACIHNPKILSWGCKKIFSTFETNFVLMKVLCFLIFFQRIFVALFVMPLFDLCERLHVYTYNIVCTYIPHSTLKAFPCAHIRSQCFNSLTFLCFIRTICTTSKGEITNCVSRHIA